MEKKILIVAFIVIAAFCFAIPAHADAPRLADQQPWMIPAAELSGLGDVESVQFAFTNFQNKQAAKYQYTTPDKWQANYNRDVTEWLHAHGCASCALTEAGLSFPLRVDLPIALTDYGMQ